LLDLPLFRSKKLTHNAGRMTAYDQVISCAAEGTCVGWVEPKDGPAMSPVGT
jgi:hypothetical protein